MRCTKEAGPVGGIAASVFYGAEESLAVSCDRERVAQQASRILEQILALDAQYRDADNGLDSDTAAALRECALVLQRLLNGTELDEVAAYI